MWVKRSTAPGPRMPNPTKPTRTTSIFGVVSPTTLVCPAGRSGVSTTMVPLSQLQWVPLSDTCTDGDWAEHAAKATQTPNNKNFNPFMIYNL